MKETFKLVISHFFMITVCVMFVTALIDILTGGSGWGYQYNAAYPWLAMLTGLLGALPTFLFYFRNEPTKKQFYTRVALHFILIQAVVMSEGFILNWYDNIFEALTIFSIILLVYAIVWFFTIMIHKNAANGINNALKNFNSDEE